MRGAKTNADRNVPKKPMEIETRAGDAFYAIYENRETSAHGRLAVWMEASQWTKTNPWCQPWR